MPWFGDGLPNAAEKIDALLGVYDRSSLLQFCVTAGSGGFELCLVVMATIAEEWFEITLTQVRRAVERGTGRRLPWRSLPGRPKTLGVRLAVALDFIIAHIPELRGVNWRHRTIARLVRDATGKPWTAAHVKREVVRNRARRGLTPCAANPVAAIYVATKLGAWLVQHVLLQPLAPHAGCGDNPRIPVIAAGFCFQSPTAARARAALVEDLEAGGFSVLPTRT
jgi:hypothetical protein